MKITPELLAIAARLKTQDNLCTAEPMFCVQEKRREHGYDPKWSDEHVWIDLENGCEEVPEDTPGAEKTGYRDTWHTVMVAFTKGGCDAYLRANGHNHGETRIYVESFRRCAEMVDIRAWLMSMDKSGEDALRQERDAAEGELLDIAAHLGCARGEIIAEIKQLQRKAGGA